MNIPKKLKIGGHTYKVNLTKDENLVRGGSFGNRNCNDMTINISSELGKSEQEATLLHEILHAINTEWEECLVENVAQGLYQVLVDNKLTWGEDGR